MKKRKKHISNNKIDIVIDTNFKNMDYQVITLGYYNMEFDTDREKWTAIYFILRNDLYAPHQIISERSRIKKPIDIFKKLFCKHNYVAVANGHGDMINDLKGKRTYVVCTNCGKGKWVDDYIFAPYDYSYSEFKEKESK